MPCSVQAQEQVIPPDVHVVRVWDCDTNWIAKGWAVNSHDCHDWDGAKTARQVLDKFLADEKELQGYEVIGQTISQVQRGGVVRKKMWTVYDFQLRLPKKQ